MKTKFAIFWMICMASLLGFNASGQILKPVKWTYSYQKISPKSGYVLMTADIGKGWHIYSQGPDNGDGPIPTSFKIQKASEYTLSGKVVPSSAAKVAFDPTFKKNIGVHSGKVVFRQKITIVSGQPIVKGSLEFMVCNDHQCLPPQDLDFEVATH